MNWLRQFRAPPVLCGLCSVLSAWPAEVRAFRGAIRDGAFPNRPRWKWRLLRGGLTVVWLGGNAWRSLFRGLRTGRRLPPERSIPPTKLLSDLLYLNFWLGALSHGYFAFRLHERPRRDWAFFVFPQEYSAWQCLFGNAGGEGRKALADKAGFARRLSEAGLSTIRTIQCLPKGRPIDLEDMFSEQKTTSGLFLKPNSANAMRGCFELTASVGEENERRYQLKGRDLKGRILDSSDAAAIQQCLEEQLREEDLLLQPLLRNHPDLKKIVPADRLITMRIITINRPAPALLHAVLELPADESHAWVLANIDMESGEILESRNPPWNAEEFAWLKSVYGLHIPRWGECRDLVLKAHSLVPDLATVGWDLAIAESGPLIIEGNSGWNVAPPQSVSGEPLLKKIEATTDGPDS